MVLKGYNTFERVPGLNADLQQEQRDKGAEYEFLKVFCVGQTACARRLPKAAAISGTDPGPLVQ